METTKSLKNLVWMRDAYQTQAWNARTDAERKSAEAGYRAVRAELYQALMAGRMAGTVAEDVMTELNRESAVRLDREWLRLRHTLGSIEG